MTSFFTIIIIAISLSMDAFSLALIYGIQGMNKIEISKIGFIIFGLSVSIDSLTIGIGLKAITNQFFLSSLTFSLTSTIFTFLGLSLGNIIGGNLGSYSKILGGIILIIIAILLFIY